MKSIKIILKILFILNIKQAHSMLELKNQDKNYKLKQLELILALTKNTENADLKKLRKLTLKDIRINPDQEILKFLAEKNIKFKEKKLIKSIEENRKNGNLVNVKLLLQYQTEPLLKFCDENKREDFQEKIFLGACKTLDFKNIKYLIETGINVNSCRREDNELPITILIDSMANLEETKEYLETLDLFFKYGVQIIYREWYNTLLMIATTNNLYKTANLIIDNYSKSFSKPVDNYINQKDNLGKNALMYAVINCNEKIKNRDQNLQQAECSEKLIKLLLENGARSDLADKDGKKALDHIENHDIWDIQLINWLTPKQK